MKLVVQNMFSRVKRKLVGHKMDYISQTPFEIYETTNGRNFPVSASNHFLTHRRGRSPIKAKGAWVYPQGPGT